MKIKKTGSLLLALIISTGIFSGPAHAEFFDGFVIDMEAGPLYIYRNDGRYGAAGTRFTAAETGQQRNLVKAFRLSMEGVFKKKHRIILLYAPLELRTSLVPDEDLRFRNTLFSAGRLLEHSYLFDGYRISYLNRIFEKGALDFDLGGTLGIRNAEVSFREMNGDKYDSESDIGVIFALKTRVSYSFANGAYLMLDADGFSTFGLAGDSVSGAIYDLKLSLLAPLRADIDFTLGARLTGGGAEVKSKNIDNWGDFVSLTAGVRVKYSGINSHK